MTPRVPLLRDRSGFTLVELLAVLAIFLVIVTALTTLFVSGSKAELDANHRFQAQQNARLALDRLRRELHCSSGVTNTTDRRLTATPVSAIRVALLRIARRPSAERRRSTTRPSRTAAAGGSLRVQGGSSIPIADYLVEDEVFTYTAASSDTRALLHVDFPVNVNPNEGWKTWRLVDDIVLRNTLRQDPLARDGNTNEIAAAAQTAGRHHADHGGCHPRRALLSGVTLIYYSGTNARSAEYSVQNASAYDLAEAGIDEMMAVLSKPTNNALMPDLLPETTHDYDGGTVTWSGTLNQLTQTWSVTSTGRIDNPTGQGASEVTRTLTAKIPVTPTLTQPLNNPAWNYIYATGTGQPCDMTVSQNVNGSSRLYVQGNLCLEKTSRSRRPRCSHGNLGLANNAGWGEHEHEHPCGDLRRRQLPLRRRLLGNAVHRQPGLAPDLFEDEPPSYTVGVNTAVPVIAAPTADVSAWYENSIPGPSLDCSTANGARSGTPPTWDNDGVMNNSVPVFNLTPGPRTRAVSGPRARRRASCPGTPTRGAHRLRDDVHRRQPQAQQRTLNSYNGQGTIYLGHRVHEQQHEALRRHLRLQLRLLVLEPEHRDADVRRWRKRRPCGHRQRNPDGQQLPVPGRPLLVLCGSLREQRPFRRADRGLDDDLRQQRLERSVRDDHDGAGRDAGEPGRLRPAEPAAALQRLRAALRQPPIGEA